MRLSKPVNRWHSSMNIIHVLGIIWASCLLLMLMLIFICKGLVWPGAIFCAMNVLFYLLLIGWAIVSSFVWPLQFLLIFLISPAFLYQILVLCGCLGSCTLPVARNSTGCDRAPVQRGELFQRWPALRVACSWPSAWHSASNSSGDSVLNSNIS